MGHMTPALARMMQHSTAPCVCENQYEYTPDEKLRIFLPKGNNHRTCNNRQASNTHTHTPVYVCVWRALTNMTTCGGVAQ